MYKRQRRRLIDFLRYATSFDRDIFLVNQTGGETFSICFPLRPCYRLPSLLELSRLRFSFSFLFFQACSLKYLTACKVSKCTKPERDVESAWRFVRNLRERGNLRISDVNSSSDDTVPFEFVRIASPWNRMLQFRLKSFTLDRFESDIKVYAFCRSVFYSVTRQRVNDSTFWNFIIFSSFQEKRWR